MATRAAPPKTTPTPVSDRARWLGMVVISLGVSLIVVDATIVNVLVPRVIDELGLRTTDAEWITAVYSLVVAALLIPAGRAGDVLGRRRMFVAGITVFTAASLGAAMASGGVALITARAAQGFGAAMIMPAALSTVTSVFTGRDRAVAFGIWGSLIGGMAALGPLLGGWLAGSYGWRWAFGVNLPLGALLVVGALRFMPETRQVEPAGGGVGDNVGDTDGSDNNGNVGDSNGNVGGSSAKGQAGRRSRLTGQADWPGGLLSALGFGFLVFGLIEGQSYGWLTATRTFSAGPYPWPVTRLSPVPVALALGVASLAALIAVERTRAGAGRPVMLDMSLFRIADYRRGNLASALISVGELGLLFVLPLFLQGVHGNSPLQISVAILPLAIGAFVAGPYAGRLAHRRGPARVVQAGMLLEVIAVLAIGLTVHAASTGLAFAPWMLLYGFGLGLTSAQLTNISLARVPSAKAGQASGTQSTSRQLGSALGIAIIGAVFATSLGHTMADRLRHAAHLPAAEVTAHAHELRESAGTYARTLHERPGARIEARAADESLAAATRRGAFTTAAILGLGLLVSLRFRRSGPLATGSDAVPDHADAEGPVCSVPVAQGGAAPDGSAAAAPERAGVDRAGVDRAGVDRAGVDRARPPGGRTVPAPDRDRAAPGDEPGIAPG